MKSRQFIKFILAGGVAAIANFGSRIILGYWMPYIPSIIIAFCIGLVSAFVLNRTFVFVNASNTFRNQAFWFTIINLAALGQTLFISVVLANHALPAIGIETHAETIAHGFGVMIPVLTSYLGHKHLSFRNV
ncbi:MULTISPECIES: GtrA family protein [unclassified Rhodanobacter]|uniref:GtrA family protein n=1 Tax=Rhodanobacter humi TaxID=1888173 RepID=A0ABV4ASC3_9GAMM